MIPQPLEIAVIHAAYRAGTLTPLTLATALLRRIEDYPDKAVFISRAPAEQVLAQARALDTSAMASQPLFGIPCVVKDNIDVAGMPTTAACPDFAYLPANDAVAVARLRAAGAIVLGKTNLDQFATGLNGTRSPYGAPRSVFDTDYCSGGSSSGSAVAVAAGLAVFSLGTDTAGSGRVPAMFNNIVGLKPSFARIPNTGAVPACKMLDCICVFANGAADALAVLRVAEGFDAADPYSRAARDVALPARPRVGVLRVEDMDFAGDGDSAALYGAAVAQAAALGWAAVEFDYAPFRDIAAALYGGPFVAERLAAVGAFFSASPDSIHPVVRGILAEGQNHSAAELYAEMYRVQALKQRAMGELKNLDFLLLPTAPSIFKVEDMLAQPVALNAKLGIYTNFVNIMDLCAIAVPAGLTPAGLPFGVTLIGRAFTDVALAGFADTIHVALGAGAGKARAKPITRMAPADAGRVEIIVAGAHLSGMVLNHELLALGGELVKTTLTAPNYKLFALATSPPKPGLVRWPGFAGAGITVETWSLAVENFGKFVAALPAPMGIGRVTLADGTEHPGFLCEAFALEEAEDITHYGGWRAFKAAMPA